MTDAAITFRSVQKRYDDLVVVRSLDLAVMSGEFLVLLGPSGCGKSTILKMLAGIEEISEGEILVNDELVNYRLPRDRDVAMVFQNYALYPHMTVAQNIAYPLRSGRRGKLSDAQIRTKVREAADLVEITDQLEKYPDALSGGQRQRVALARAVIRDPAVFLMDEPLSNLDAQLRDSMRQQLIALHRRVGKATIYVTHDQLEAMTMADRIVVMNGGVVQQHGRPKDIFRKPANLFVAGFVGHPRMNFIPGISLGGTRVSIGDAILETAGPTGAEGDQVTVGLRPTDAQTGTGPNTVAGTVTDVEFTGADSIVTVSGGSLEGLRIRHSGRDEDFVGEDLTITFAPEHVHVFDAEGMRL